jgi:hypothetical protein
VLARVGLLREVANTHTEVVAAREAALQASRGRTGDPACEGGDDSLGRERGGRPEEETGDH